MERGCGLDAPGPGSSSRPAWVRQGRGGAYSLPQRPRPHSWACRRRGIPAGGTGAVPAATRPALWPDGGRLPLSRIIPGLPRSQDGSEGREKGSPAPERFCPAGAEPTGAKRCGVGGPWAGLLVRPWAREGIWAGGGWQGPALKRDPRTVFRLWGGRQDKEGSSQLHFPRMSPRGRRHMPMILINIFLRNIITERKLGFNSRLITRGAAVCAGMAALGGARPPRKLRIRSPSKLPCQRRDGGEGVSFPPSSPSLGVGNPHLTPEVSRAPCILISPPNSLTPAGDNSIDI